MIAFLEGKTAGVDENRLYLNVNGVGYEVFMPMRSLDRIDPRDSEVFIYTYMVVREDAMQLFGFLNREDKQVFTQLLTVSGIGPKGALSVLSTLTADDLRFAVFSDDVKLISSVPGLGKKTAQKLILELKDKLKLEDTINKDQTGEITGVTEGDPSNRKEAIDALAALGFSAAEASRAVRSIPGVDELSVEEILKLALKEMSS